MHIILDFDYTLFNTTLLKEALQHVVEKHGVSEELFFKTYEEAKRAGRDYTPSRQFEILQARGIWNISDLRRSFDEVMGNCRSMVYDDTLAFLERVKQKYLLALLSYGDDAFQNAKIESSGLVQYFENVVVTQNILKDKEADDLSEGKKAIFVDDNPAALAAAKKRAQHIVTMRMKRLASPYVNEPAGEGVDYEVSALNELEDIIMTC